MLTEQAYASDTGDDNSQSSVVAIFIEDAVPSLLHTEQDVRDYLSRLPSLPYAEVLNDWLAVRKYVEGLDVDRDAQSLDHVRSVHEKAALYVNGVTQADGLGSYVVGQRVMPDGVCDIVLDELHGSVPQT
jgi:homospermidine synthase